MTDDLKAIDVLSQRFIDAIKDLPRQGTDHSRPFIRIQPDHAIILQGDRVLRLYESELEKAPDDDDVKFSLARHRY